MRAEPVTLALGGDVMLGRGVDQVLPHPGDPALRERWVRDARTYVELAEEASGPVYRPAGFGEPWGDALEALDRAAPHARVLNLETSVTRSGDFAPGKGVHYRMSPANLPALTTARPDVCVLANNHVLDFGRRGLAETLGALHAAGLATAGAGRDAAEAREPARVPLAGGGRLLVASCGTASSGIPRDWAAGEDTSGVDFLAAPAPEAAERVAGGLRRIRRPGDVAVVSVHWGPNWGYEVAPEEAAFAHALVDAGVDVVHGHSSHHPRPAEVYRGRLVLYGCGDLVDDYEGITGYEEYRDDLRLLHLVTLEAATGALVEARMVPLQAHRMRLRYAPDADAEWLRAVLDEAGRELDGAAVRRAADGSLVLAAA